MAEQGWGIGGDGDFGVVGEMRGASLPPAVQHELRPLTTGEILDRTFFLYRSRFWLYVGLSAVAAAMSVVASIGRLVYFHFMTSLVATSPKGVIVSSVISILGALLYYAVYSVTHAATVSAVSSVYLGQETSVGTAFGSVRGQWLRYCLISLWQSWSGAWSFTLIVIPIVFLWRLGGAGRGAIIALLVLFAFFSTIYGVIAYIRNSLAIPASVVEDLPVRKAMRRSKVLVAGRKGRIFLLGLLLFALYMVAGALQMPFALLILHSRSAEHVLVQVISLLVAFLCSSLIGPVAAIALCLFYFDERVRKEAFDIEFLMNKTSAPMAGGSGDAAVEPA